MPLDILTPDEMGEADRRAIAAGPLDGVALMERAGAAVSAEILARFPQAVNVDVLCGPGNNGGDGYVIARLLARNGVAVRVWADAAPRAGSDAAKAAQACPLKPRGLADFEAEPCSLVVDALFGAGLSRELEGNAARAVEAVRNRPAPVVAVDLPSGISGETGRVLGSAFQAALTVTFVRKKPGHVLLPGRQHCGEVIVADIGITGEVVAGIGAACFENRPELWRRAFPTLAEDAHKYRRGHVAVISGGLASTGAARLSAMAAARIGAGAVTLLSPGEALATNAAHLTSIILRRADSLEDATAFFEQRKPASLVVGPGLGLTSKMAASLPGLIRAAGHISTGLVFDADALTLLGREPDAFAALTGGDNDAVLTPHEGEFGRLFPAIAEDEGLSKLEKARAAAKRAKAVIIYKGPDTVIASPNGRAAINANGTPLLATAGSGDVLSGFVAGLLAQGMPAFEAACAAVWLHAEAARAFGPGLIAEDLPLALRPVLRKLKERV